MAQVDTSQVYSRTVNLVRFQTDGGSMADLFEAAALWLRGRYKWLPNVRSVEAGIEHEGMGDMWLTLELFE